MMNSAYYNPTDPYSYAAAAAAAAAAANSNESSSYYGGSANNHHDPNHSHHPHDWYSSASTSSAATYGGLAAAAVAAGFPSSYLTGTDSNLSNNNNNSNMSNSSNSNNHTSAATSNNHNNNNNHHHHHSSNSNNETGNLLCPGDVAAGGGADYSSTAAATSAAAAAGYHHSSMYGGGGDSGSSSTSRSLGRALTHHIDHLNNYNKLVDSLCGVGAGAGAADYNPHHHPFTASSLYPCTPSLSRTAADMYFPQYYPNPTNNSTSASSNNNNNANDNSDSDNPHHHHSTKRLYAANHPHHSSSIYPSSSSSEQQQSPVLFMLPSPVVPSTASSSSNHHRYYHPPDFTNTIQQKKQQQDTDDDDDDNDDDVVVATEEENTDDNYDNSGDVENDTISAVTTKNHHHHHKNTTTHHGSNTTNKSKNNRCVEEDGYLGFTLNVPGVSLEPMTATDMLDRINIKTDEVVTRYLPCVDFLVACQQELRSGLAEATRKIRNPNNQYNNNNKRNSPYPNNKNNKNNNLHSRYRDALTPRQFFNRYIGPLGKRFLQSNEPIMPTKELHSAYSGIEDLVTDAKKEICISCESVKNMFLGGMRDGESWGLRRWLSQHGGALKICNDLELIYGALKQKSSSMNNDKHNDKYFPVLVKLAERIRPKAQQALDRLRNDVPTAYQQISSAHPYLPFFHRLESALRSLTNFDPEEDDVICLDDSSDEDDDDNRTQLNSNSNRKRQQPSLPTSPSTQQKKHKTHHTANTTGTHYHANHTNNHYHSDDDDDSDIEVVGVKPAQGSAFDKYEKNEEEEYVAGNNETNDNTFPSSSVSEHREQQQQQNSHIDNHQQITAALATNINNTNEMNRQNLQTFTETTESTNDSINKKSGGWRCKQCTYLNSANSHKCIMCSDDDFDGEQAVVEELLTIPSAYKPTTSLELANKLVKLSSRLEIGDVRRPSILQENEDLNADFWNTTGQLVYVLKIFQMILYEPTSQRHANPPEHTQEYLPKINLYNSVVRTSLSFNDIVNVLVDEEFHHGIRGRLKPRHLNLWNMFNARDLVQAIDLVFLNSLCYEGRTCPTQAKIETKRLRKILWDKVHLRGGPAKITKRSETSGFVAKKQKVTYASTRRR